MFKNIQVFLMLFLIAPVNTAGIGEFKKNGF